MRDAEAQLIHDVRNAATVIHAAVAHLSGEDYESLPPKVRARLLEALGRRSDMLVRLVEDLSVLHHLDRGDLTLETRPVAVDEVCRDVVDGLRPGRDCTVHLAVEPDTVALADPICLTRVVDNLVINAVRHGGDHIEVRACGDGDTVTVEVLDDGPGVPEELVDTLFDRYARGQGSGSSGGSGLGLSIVKELCQAQGGSIRYDATHGCRFVATFRAAPGLSNAGRSAAETPRTRDDDDAMVA